MVTMRTGWKTMDCKVAVPAQHPVARWEASPAEETIGLRSSPMTVGSPIGITSSIDMIDREKDGVSLTAAGTSGITLAIRSEDIHPQLLSIATPMFRPFGRMHLMPALDCLRILPPVRIRHTPIISHLRDKPVDGCGLPAVECRSRHNRRQ